MDASHESKTALRNNPFFVISIALIVALMMSAISLVTYYHSETRLTVEQIQQNNLETADDVLRATPEELSGEYIDQVERQVTQSVESLSTDTDYSPDELTDAALGL